MIRWTPKSPADTNAGLEKACRLFEFVENELKIRTKRQVVVTRHDGKRVKTQLVPFRFNAVQMILAQDMAQSWYQGLPFKRLIPKARQMGISTWFLAIFFGISVNTSDYHVALIAHNEEGGDEIFTKAHVFNETMDAAVSVNLTKRQGSRLEWVNRSTMWVGSIRQGDGLGKGPTLSGIHFSECANFQDGGVKAVDNATSIKNSVADDPMAIIAYESTAKGRDGFFWAQCMRALDPKAAIEDRVIFLPWFLDPDYSMTWSEYRSRLEGKKIAANFVPTADERVLRNQLEDVFVTRDNHLYTYKVKLTNEQLIWRRFKIANDCYDKLSLFQRYYPSTFEEAFTSTVQCLFSAQTVDHYSRNSRNAVTRGNFLVAGAVSVSFHADRQGFTRIWRDVVPGEKYVIGADVGGDKRNSDPCAAYVLNMHDLEVVAAIHGFMDYDEFAEYLCAAGRYFNNALLAVENNHNPAVAKSCFKAGYPNCYHYMDEASLKLNLAPKPGFNTNRKTRPELVSYLDRVTRTQKLTCPDKWFAREMEHFCWVERDKTHKASGSFTDDRIMAMGIAIYCCPDAVSRQEEVEQEKLGWAYSLYLKMERHTDADDRYDEEVLVL